MDLNIQTLIGSGIASILAAFFTLVGSQKIFLKQHERNSIEKAIELAKFYGEEIIPLISYISHVYSQNKELQKYYKKLNAYRKNKTLNFDYEEMEEIFAEEVSEIEKIINRNVATSECLHAAHFLYTNELISYKGDPAKREEFVKLKLDMEFKSVVPLLLNRLEYISMLLARGVADSETIYQSLHQTFFSAVIFLYFNISLENKDNKDKYFVNTISLYNEWYKKYSSKEKDEKSHKENLADKPKRFNPIR